MNLLIAYAILLAVLIVALTIYQGGPKRQQWTEKRCCGR